VTSDQLTWIVIRVTIFFLVAYFGRAALRRRNRERTELMLTRDREQAELFEKELPPLAAVHADVAPRVACKECGELTPIDELDEVEDGPRICRTCRERIKPKTPSTYRG